MKGGQDRPMRSNQSRMRSHLKCSKCIGKGYIGVNCLIFKTCLQCRGKGVIR